MYTVLHIMYTLYLSLVVLSYIVQLFLKIIETEPLTYVNTVKYLGFVFCENKNDDEDMLKQMRSLYAKSNKVIRMFNHCTVDVKLLLIKSYCTSFYCGYLWSDYKSMTFGKLRVAFNNVFN